MVRNQLKKRMQDGCSFANYKLFLDVTYCSTLQRQEGSVTCNLQFSRICKKQGKGYSQDMECGMLTYNGRNRQRNDKNRKLCDGNV